MKTNCNGTHSLNVNYSNSCCVTHLIIMHYRTNNNFLINRYGILLVKTLNSYLKQNELLIANDISLEQLSVFLGILSKYSSIYYYKFLTEYSKLLIKFGLRSINQSNFKSKAEIIQLKNAFYNNLACVYLNEHKCNKADNYIHKCLKCVCDYNDENEGDYISKAITYNNIGLIEIKRKHIHSALKCFKKIYNEIKHYFNADMPENNSKKKEVLVFVMYNYFCIMKKYSQKDISSIYNKIINYSKSHLGDNHIISINLNEVETINRVSLSNSSLSSSSLHSSLSDSSSSSSSYLSVENSIMSNQCANNSNKNNNQKDTDLFACPELNNIRKKSHDVINEEDEKYETDEIHNKESKQETFMSFSQNTPVKNQESIGISIKNINKTHQNSFIYQKNSELSSSITFNSLKYNNSINDKLNETTKTISENNNLLNKLEANAYDSLMKHFEKTEKRIEYIVKKSIKVQMLKKKLRTAQIKRINVFTPILSKKSHQELLIDKTNTNTKINMTDIFNIRIIEAEEEEKLIDLNKYIEIVHNFEVIDAMNNVYKSKKTNMETLEEVKLRILVNSTYEPYIIIRAIKNLTENNIPYIISISINEKYFSITIAIYKINNDNVLRIEEYVETYDFDEVIDYLAQISYFTSMPLHCDLSFILNIEMLIHQIIVKHYHIVLDGDNIELCLLHHQLGLSNKANEFIYINSLCSCSLTMNGPDLCFIISDKEDQSVYLRFDIAIDESSFNFFFDEKELQGITQYCFKETVDYVPIFTEIFMKTQEILKISTNGDCNPQTLKEVVKFCSESIFRLSFENELKKKELWVITKSKNEVSWKIDFYTLEKIKLIDGEFYFHKSITLDWMSFENVIGSNLYDVIDLMTNKDKVIVLKLLLNSIKLEDIDNDEISKMTQKEYDANVSLIKISPSSLFKYSFVLNHLGKYYCCSFEYLLYTNECYYLRFTLTEVISLRSYSKIYLPYIMFRKEKNNSKPWVKLNSNYTEFHPDKFRYKSKLNKVLLEEALGILAKNTSIVFFENDSIILHKLSYVKS